MLRQVMMGLAAVAGLAVWVAQPAQAKDWPNGYDPQSGLTWEEDFTYSPWNPFGSPPGAYGRPDFFFRGGPQFAPPGSYSYGSPSYSYGCWHRGRITWRGSVWLCRMGPRCGSTIS